MDYPIRPVAFTEVNLADTFWRPRLETNRNVTIPYDFKKCEETGRIDNFLKAAGELKGKHEGLYFNDSDVFKVIEGAAYSLSLQPDPELESYLDELITKVASAQEEDGYLYTARTVDPKRVRAEWEGLERWSNLRRNHELYNAGHLYEAAVAHHRATGKRSLLNIALKNADLVERIFGPGKKLDVPGHQEIELGLVKLYRVTGKKKYLELAKFFLDERGHANGRELYTDHGNDGYMQDHLPVVNQEEAVGHAVRALYMYAGMADVAALIGDGNYLEALETLWENVVSKKMYLTGGVGARHEGEAFGDNYELPNTTAYAETCAAIANIMWNHRMFLLHGDAKYLDILERTLYNGFLSGVSLSGDRFFYANPLASDGSWKFNREESATRNPWFDCSCCPTNVVRILPSLPGYLYAVRGDELYLNLFVSGRGLVEVGGTMVHLEQVTDYPWDGRITLTLKPEAPVDFTLAVRVPGWARNETVPSDLYRYLERSNEEVTLTVNGEPAPLELEKGFFRINRSWKEGDSVQLTLPMPVRRVLANEKVANTRERVAVERGPLVYCAEGVDNGGHALDLALADDTPLTPKREKGLLGGVTLLCGNSLTLIPYYAWSHRGEGEMALWLQRKREV